MLGFKLPEDFLIGTGHSAFQSEGAWDRDGKSESIMEYFAKKYGGEYIPWKKMSRPFSEVLPDRGCFFYDNYEEYIEDMAKTGQNTYRFSLAWTRIIPTGVGEVNPKGIEFYNKVIDKLLEHNITPFVDLYHWDLPMCLFEKGGFVNPQFPEWFEAYAKVCFEAFGDRVKYWSTFNESHVSLSAGHATGTFPPFHRDKKESLLGAHHVILAHFRAVRLYKSMDLGGKIGAVNCITSVTPADMKEEDLRATYIQTENTFGWWTQAMLEGTYPQILIREVPYIRDNMPENYQKDLDEWFIPMDFVGINYYTTSRTRFDPKRNLLSSAAEPFFSSPGQQFVTYPAGLFDVAYYIHQRYHGIEIYITENGYYASNINDEEKECDDPERASFIREHLRMCARLIKVGVNLKGYYYWCDADAYEELDGYRLRFGLTWVDHETGRRRWKNSRYFFSDICKTHMVN